MDAFEQVVAMLLRREGTSVPGEGWWTTVGYKVVLEKQEKREIGKSSTPRWEVDVLAYNPLQNLVRMVECKSYLDSRGVVFKDGMLQRYKRYKLFHSDEQSTTLRRVVFHRLGGQLLSAGMIRPDTKIQLALATGKIASVTNRDQLREYFTRMDFHLYDEDWVREKLAACGHKATRYENDPAHVVAKILSRQKKLPRKRADTAVSASCK